MEFPVYYNFISQINSIYITSEYLLENFEYHLTQNSIEINSMKNIPVNEAFDIIINNVKNPNIENVLSDWLF